MSFRWNLPPALRSNPKKRDFQNASRAQRTADDQRDSHPQRHSFPRGSHLRLCWLCTQRQHVRARSPNFHTEPFLVHSPLLKESYFVCHPPLTYMLNSAGLLAWNHVYHGTVFASSAQLDATSYGGHAAVPAKGKQVSPHAKVITLMLARNAFCWCYFREKCHQLNQVKTLRQACFQECPRSAGCVQGFVDSRNSACHSTYRISLHSSSLLEPRHPSLKVQKERTATNQSLLAIQTTRQLGYISQKGYGQAALEFCTALHQKKASSCPERHVKVHKMCGYLVRMILPQVHLRKPCYDFSFL